MENLPVDDLSNRIVATCITLANGTKVPAMLGNVNLHARRPTLHFLCLSVAHRGKWFHLARYFDIDYATRGPQALADLLGLPMDQVFPISYDISDVALGLREVAKGQTPAEPAERLTPEERLALALET